MTDAPAAAAGATRPHQEPGWLIKADELGYRWVRKNWERAAARPNSWYDAEKADKIVASWPVLFTLTILHFAGVPFHLSFWQECIVRLFFGWKVEIDVVDPRSKLKTKRWVRLFRELRLWIPRKNGKTEFIAAMALLVWYYEGLHGGEGYCFARDEKQAAIPFARMKAMVLNNDDLARDVRPYREVLWCQRLLAPFHLITAKAEGKHGRVPFVTLGDEMHEWRSRDLADNLRQGEGPQLQPVRLYASTSGLKSKQMVGRELFEESEQILAGTLDDPTVLIAIFAATDDDDWTDEKVWERVNPNIGISPTWEFLRDEARKAKVSKSAETKFRCFHLNQWVEDLQKWIPIKKWDAAARIDWKTILTADEFKGRDVHLAFDSTWTFDFGALCVRFLPRAPDELPIFAWLSWLPAETLEKRELAERRPFSRWRDDKAIEEIPGGTFENRFAIKATRELVQRFNVLKIGWDSWGAKEYYNQLVNPPAHDDAVALPGDLFVEMRFGTKTLGEASKQFERRFLTGKLEHGGNPVARWMAEHCAIRFDENLNFVPAKKQSEKSIDLIMTAVMTEALALPPRDTKLADLIEKGEAVF